MQIIEVKNNLVKIGYDTSTENLTLSGFVVIKDSSHAFIAQIIHLESNSSENFAIVKLLFNFDDNGVVSNYNGSIPESKSLIDIVHPQELLELLPLQNPILFGELAQQNTLLNLDRSILEEKLLVCSEKEEDSGILIKNLAAQLINEGKKVVIFDFNGTLDINYNPAQNKILAGRDFKLPLNNQAINFIYEKGLDDAKAETKALIQDVFLEVQEYIKTLKDGFVPFETFKNIVADQYKETELIELVLLKNKLLRYYEAGIFAQEKSEFNSLKLSLKRDELTFLDLSRVDDAIQREMISYTYSLINEFSEQNKEFYVIFNVDNSTSDKKLLKQIYTTQNAYSTLICSYSYKYLKELKQLAKNIILFAPIQQQNDFAGYNTFLAKLNPHEFIVYGNATHHLPLIVKLSDLSHEISQSVYKEATPLEIQEETPISQADLLDEEIKKDVDEFYIAPKFEEIIEDEPVEDELTEDDLDFIDHLGIEPNLTENNAEEFEEELIEEESQELSIEEEFSNIEREEPIEETDFEDATFSEVLTQQQEQGGEEPPMLDILPVKMASTPIVPIYSAEIEPKADSDALEQGDMVTHQKYGKGTVEKLISYGSKTLCSINFDNVGRRLLDPSLAEIKKI